MKLVICCDAIEALFTWISFVNTEVKQDCSFSLNNETHKIQLSQTL